MKLNAKYVVKLLIILFLSTSFVHGQQKIVLKGTQITKTHDDIDVLSQQFENLMAIIFDGSTQRESYTTVKQTFSIAFTSSTMRMEAEIRDYRSSVETITTHSEDDLDVKEKRYKAILELIFSPEGTELQMKVFTKDMSPSLPPQEFKLLVNTWVPKAKTYTVSQQNMDLVSSGGTNGEPWNQYSTKTYNYTGATTTEGVLAEGENVENNQLYRKDISRLTVALGVEGVEIMDAFYTKLFEEGFDIGGSDQGSLLSSIGFFLSEGLPIYAKENRTYYFTKDGEQTQLGIFQSETKITDVQVVNDTEPLQSDIDVNQSSTATMDPIATNGETRQADQPPKPKGCDCSCDKYKELMAFRDKKKKDIDPAQLQQIDMKCIQKCAMAWSKCKE